MVSGPEPPPYKELVQAAAKAVGATSPRQLADAIGLTGRDEDKAVRNWWNGVNGPNYEATMRLLALAGWLTMDGAASARRVSAAPVDPLAELAAGVRDLADGQAQLIQEVRELTASAAAVTATGPARPRRKRGAG